MASFDEIVSKMTAAVKGVREAVLGKDVREFIASGYESVLDAYKQLNTAVDSAASSAEKAKTAITEAIDPTLSVSRKAADAKATGDALETERKRIDVLNDGGLNLKDEVIDTSIKTWLTDHPEATTTVQDGTITENKMNPAMQYNRKPNYYSALAELIADKLIRVGTVAITLGFYKQRDGGGAKYIVRTRAEDDIDGVGVVLLKNGLSAEMVIEHNEVAFEQLGAKCDDNTFDCNTYLIKYISLCNKIGKKIKLKIGNGVWYFSPTHIYRTWGVHIEGTKSFRAGNKECTQISPINASQSYIWKIGGSEKIVKTIEEQKEQPAVTAVRSVVIDGIVFSGGNFSGWAELDSALYVDCCMYCTFDNLYFQNVRGTALTIRQSWEIYWGMLNFRGIAGFDSPCIHIPPTTDPYANVAENVSANYFGYLMFEGIDGDYIFSEGASGFEHNEINDMQIEISTCNLSGTQTVQLTENDDRTNMINNHIFKGFARYLVINMINIFTAKNFYTVANGKKYILSGVIGNDESITSDYYGAQDITINTLKIFNRAASSGNSLAAVYGKNCIGEMAINIGQLILNGNGFVPFFCDGSTPINVALFDSKGAYKALNNVCYLGDVSNRTPVLYTDTESLNPKKLVVKGNVIKKTIALAFLSCNCARKRVKLRIKGDDGVNYKFRLQGKKDGQIKDYNFSYTGNGAYEYYVCDGMDIDDGYLQVIGAITDKSSLTFDTLELVN